MNANAQKIATPFDLKKANRYLAHIALVGLGIGTANYIMNGDLSWFQWLIQSVITSLIIGYTLITIAANKLWFSETIQSKLSRLAIVFVAFFITGALASEVEQVVRSLVFSDDAYKPFSAGKMYIFNGIISIVLGYSFYYSQYLFPSGEFDSAKDLSTQPNSDVESKDKLESKEHISTIPVKQGEHILLVPVQDIAFFEAFDNYSYLYDLTGKKRICDYSLRFLQDRLDGEFLRIHRKYIINTSHIAKISPHLNGRYVIDFNVSELPSVTSSKSFNGDIRKLIKIE